MKYIGMSPLMPTFHAYAIRQVSTGYFLPMRWKQARGYTHDDPTPDCFPRLFRTHKSAEYALRAWLKGEWSEQIYYSSLEGFSESSGPEVSKERPDRKREDMEIVVIELREVS